MTARERRIVFLAVQDAAYPRHVRLRSFLEGAGFTVAVVPLRGRVPRWRRWREAVRALLVHGRRADHYVLAEFSNKFAVLAWLWAKLNRGSLLVDGFVGLHETRIGDWADAAQGSLLSRWYRLLDGLAVAVSEAYFIDTEYRAAAVRSQYPRAIVRSLPVGAPEWARPGDAHEPGSPIRILFYGNYLPLHGADRIVEGLSMMEGTDPSRLIVTMVGSGSGREAVVRLARERGLEHVISFLDAMTEERLAEHLRASDVVMGVFGSSDKAKSVIPNKVWQGLASGAIVVTQRSPALAEIEGIVGQQLVQTDSSAMELGRNIELAVARARTLDASSTADALEAYVHERFTEELGEALSMPGRTR
ncbi:glycosyltransferase [Clavibacter michiganensis]|nr:glycosyltransferase [Clavibacter michiganensis]